MERIRAFEERYRANGLRVLLVDVGQDEAAARALLEPLGVTFPTALDTDGDTGAAWGVTALPTHVWIDGDGIVRNAARIPISRMCIATRIRP